MSKLTESAMLVTIHLPSWRASKVCKKTTNEVLDSKRASRDAGKFTKYLAPKEMIEPVTQAQTAARSEFYKWTLPWTRGADHLLSTAVFFDFRNAMDEHKAKCSAAYDAFERIYPDILRTAPSRLNGLFDPRDFPKPGLIRLKFGFDLHWFPIPDAEDFRVKLGEDAEQQIRSGLEDGLKTRLAEAEEELWSRLLKATEHLVERTTGNKTKKFHASAVENLRAIAKLAPRLNVGADPKVTAISEQLLDLLDGVKAEELREDPKLRKGLNRKAKATLAEIEEAMQGVFA